MDKPQSRSGGQRPDRYCNRCRALLKTDTQRSYCSRRCASLHRSECMQYLHRRDTEVIHAYSIRGLSAPRVASELNVNLATVYAVLRKHQIERRSVSDYQFKRFRRPRTRPAPTRLKDHLDRIRLLVDHRKNGIRLNEWKKSHPVEFRAALERAALRGQEANRRHLAARVTRPCGWCTTPITRKPSKANRPHVFCNRQCWSHFARWKQTHPGEARPKVLQRLQALCPPGLNRTDVCRAARRIEASDEEVRALFALRRPNRVRSEDVGAVGEALLKAMKEKAG